MERTSTRSSSNLDTGKLVAGREKRLGSPLRSPPSASVLPITPSGSRVDSRATSPSLRSKSKEGRRGHPSPSPAARPGNAPGLPSTPKVSVEVVSTYSLRGRELNDKPRERASGGRWTPSSRVRARAGAAEPSSSSPSTIASPLTPRKRGRPLSRGLQQVLDDRFAEEDTEEGESETRAACAEACDKAVGDVKSLWQEALRRLTEGDSKIHKIPLITSRYNRLADTTKTYSAEGYSAMIHDGRRNAAYEAALDEFVGAFPYGPLLEVGPGADATLTKMVVKLAVAGKYRSKITGVEGNGESARLAEEVLKLQFPKGYWGSFNIIHAMSTAPKAQTVLDEGFVGLLHELLGYFASKEGVAHVVADVQRRRSKPFWVLPSLTGTFYAPAMCARESFHLPMRKPVNLALVADNHETALVQAFRFSKLCPGWPFSGCLEWLDLQKPMKGQLLQRRQCNFSFKVPTEINCIAVYIWAGFPELPAESKPFAGSLFRKATWDTPPPGLTPSCPDPDLIGWPSSLCLTSSFSSCVDLRPHASNWPNAVLFLPETITLQPGECLNVQSISDMTRSLPSYSWEVAKVNRKGLSVQTVSVEFHSK